MPEVARRIPTDEDRHETIGRLLRGIVADDDPIDIAADVVELHPKNDTFPGEVYLHVGAAALELAGAATDTPIPYEGLLETHLPETRFLGKENRKIQFAVLGISSTRGGIEPDLLDETYWWHTDDFWRYALLAAVAVIRASAARLDITPPELARQLASRFGVELNDPPANG